MFYEYMCRSVCGNVMVVWMSTCVGMVKEEGGGMVVVGEGGEQGSGERKGGEGSDREVIPQKEWGCG